ncbi:Type IV pilus biogenesis protein PilF [Lysobacter dokdonensis DS-58]|uniref:Type IV pilus biogenesis protein PilF n=1 Tax=Lysobacter dokdonensis DS-58 TaxID=1300345 RepID=A0A0A2WGW3_9GAMM|nr:Type IV pilus biogenesis protein PilF [Lysobacter dokdonensis DS-58]
MAFVKTDPSRKDFESTTEPVVVHETAASRNRLTARNSLTLSEERLRSGDFAAAEKYAKQALKADPNSPDAYTMLGAIADVQGQSAQAGQQYQRAADMAPTDGRTLNNYGAWLCKNGQARASLDWFDRALQAPGYGSPAAALANAGSCALDAGDTVRAERDLRQAIDASPENPVALGAFARVQFRAGRYLEARAFSERRLAAAPADAEALILASQIEDKLGDSAAAARYVRRLREEFPGAAQGNAGGSKSQ